MNLTQTAVINGHDIKNMLLGAYAVLPPVTGRLTN